MSISSIMRRYDTRRIAAEAVSARPDRPATALMHDHPHARLLVFRLAAGQEVAPHRSASSVFLMVVEGPGTITDAEGAMTLSAGEVASFEPEELHGIRADHGPCVVLAMIAPSPSAHTPLRIGDKR